jgi:hypothetical protein
MSNQTVSVSPSEGETVLQLSDVVCAVINNPQFVDAIIPMVLDKVLEAIRRPYLFIFISNPLFTKFKSLIIRVLVIFIKHTPSLSETVMSNQTVSTSPSEGETVLQLADVVCAVINNPQFVDAIIPMVLDSSNH